MNPGTLQAIIALAELGLTEFVKVWELMHPAVQPAANPAQTQAALQAVAAANKPAPTK